MRRTQSEQDKLIAQISRIEGQVRGIGKMIAADRYCIDVLIQVQAARAALTRVGLLILEDHAKGCVVDAVQRGEEKVIDELVDAVKKFVR
ncbi:metal-sensitive transcriptional regulator [Anaeroselena agilis]|uniref:Metal-sensitive transcriptional regulator n=1 Tax=Anaeroselena agilis TaxID=3063788 RepID=A0ABU3NZ61_9FIRM|nr:metal-sensitive transcriptional regulator [Selenomonadales bacterium 4137-cl]